AECDLWHHGSRRRRGESRSSGEGVFPSHEPDHAQRSNDADCRAGDGARSPRSLRSRQPTRTVDTTGHAGSGPHQLSEPEHFDARGSDAMTRILTTTLIVLIGALASAPSVLAQ